VKVLRAQHVGKVNAEPQTLYNMGLKGVNDCYNIYPTVCDAV
jgi:hypothetical protein